MGTLPTIENNKKWQYRLISSLGDSLLEINPIGWDSKELNLVRDDVYGGVFRTYSADLEFIRNGYDILTSLEESEGINAECTLQVLNKNTVTGENTEVFSSKLDFSEYSESSKNGKGVKIPLTDSTFLEKLRSREDIDIPYDSDTDLDGNSIEAGIYTDISLLGREFGGRAIGKVYDSSDTEDANFYPFATYINYVANTTVDNTSNLPNFQDVLKKAYNGTVINQISSYDCIYYYDDLGTAIIRGTFNIDCFIDQARVTISLNKGYFNENGEIVTFEQIVIFGTRTGNAQGSEEFDLTLTKQQGLFILIQSLDVFGSLVVNNQFGLSISFYSRFAPTDCKVALPFEVFDYIITAITGETDSFRSNYFGRTDLGYENDGEGAYLALTNGKLIRGFDIGYQTDDDEIRSQLTFTFKELFENFYKIKGIALSVIEEDGKQIIEIEKKIDIFSDDIIHTVIPDKDSLERVRYLDMYYSDIEAGYSIESTDLFGGLEEYINKETYSTPIINVDNTLELVSSYSASGVQIEKQRRLQASEYPTTESDYDLKNFIIELWNDEFEGIVQREEQGFDDIQGLDNLKTKINLGLTPNQIVRNHGWEISAGVYKFVNSNIKYCTSDKVTDLKYQITGEELYTENDDIAISKLESSIMTGYTLEFTAPLSLSNFITIRNNPTGLIKVWSKLRNEYIYGWIKEISLDPVHTPTKWILYEANPPDVGTVKLLSTNESKIVVIDNNQPIQVT